LFDEERKKKNLAKKNPLNIFILMSHSSFFFFEIPKNFKNLFIHKGMVNKRKTRPKLTSKQTQKKKFA
jgi:hypothetical protein